MQQAFLIVSHLIIFLSVRRFNIATLRRTSLFL